MRETLLKTDVTVIGGGPAGLAAAIAARLAGFDVTVVDRRGPYIDKACGEGIMPDGVKVLDDLGVTLAATGGSAFRGIRFLEGDIEATGYFAGQPGIGVRRTLLHSALVQRAAALGVRCLWQRRVLGLDAHEVRLDGDCLRTRYVIAADGQDSRVRRWVGLSATVSSRRVGRRRHYGVQPWSDVVEVHWSTSCEAYVTPIAGDAICVAVLTDDHTLGFDAALRRFPALQGRLEAAERLTDDLAAPTTSRRCRCVVSGRVALVGDASGSVDAITGKGVALALHESVALATCLKNGDLRAYARAHRKLIRLPAVMSALMLTIDRHPGLRRRTLRALGHRPWLFARLLSLHTHAPNLSGTDLGPSRTAASRTPILWPGGRSETVDPRPGRLNL